MVRKLREYPEQGELVLGTIKKVNPYSVFVYLDEYGKEGMIHIGEIARKWIKDIRDFVKENQKIVALVMDVKKEKGHITLSLKRVSKRDAEERMKEFKREQKAEKMLELVGNELKMTLDQAYEKIGFELQEIFGEMFKAFQIALTNEELLKRKGIPEKYVKIIKTVAEKTMEIREITIKGILELKCFESDGIEIIKDSLKKAKEKYGIDIKYISAPNYSLSLKTKDAKEGEKILEDAGKFIINNIKGEGNFRIE